MAWRLKSVLFNDSVNCSTIGGGDNRFFQNSGIRLSAGDGGIHVVLEGGYVILARAGHPDRIRVSAIGAVITEELEPETKHEQAKK